MQKIVPNLWFDDQAEEAANYYASIFKNSKVGTVTHYGKSAAKVAGRPEGSVLTVEFEVEGQTFVGLNGGPAFKFSEAVSFQVNCKDQAEVDELWGKLTADGGQESVCGWLKDKYGVSWQIVPDVMNEMMRDGGTEKQERMMNAMLQMKKLDVAALQKAYDGNSN